jgi:hypothetical protein
LKRSTTTRTAAENAFPGEIGLRPRQQQERLTGLVPQQPDHQPRRVVGGIVVAVVDHRRPPRPVVVELVDVEAGDHGAALGSEVPRREPTGAAGRQETIERVDQHRPLIGAQAGHVVDDVDQRVLRLLGHRDILALV